MGDRGDGKLQRACRGGEGGRHRSSCPTQTASLGGIALPSGRTQL